MQLKKAFLERVVTEVEDLAERVALSRLGLRSKKMSVTLEHRWKLEYVRNRFADFKRRAEELAEASDENLEEARKASALAWKDLEYAVEGLLSAFA